MTTEPTDPSTPPAIAIVVSRYHHSVTDALLTGAIEAYAERFSDQSRLGIIDAPGAFELPVLCSIAADCGLYEGVVALGCVLKGETSHNEHICRAVTDSLARVSTDATIPVGFGVLTCDTLEQAVDRAGGTRGNKGREAMAAVLDTLESVGAILEAMESEDPGAVRRTLIRQIAKLGQEQA